MSIIHENPPDPTTASAEDLSVAAYQAFALDHEADVSAWTDAEARAFAYLSAQARAQVRQTGPETWTQVDPATGEERRFTSGVAAVLWVADHLVTA